MAAEMIVELMNLCQLLTLCRAHGSSHSCFYCCSSLSEYISPLDALEVTELGQICHPVVDSSLFLLGFVPV